MAKRISQETFDEAVKENMEEFEMASGEAIKDAIKQFQGQGIDLDGIDVSGGIGRAEIDAAITEVIRLSTTSVAEAIEIELAIHQLSILCAEKTEWTRRNQSLLYARGGFTALFSLFQTQTESDGVIKSIINLLGQISKAKVEYRDFFGSSGSDSLCRAASLYGDNNLMVSSAMRFARIVAKSENNKAMLMQAGLGEIIVKHVTSTLPTEPSIELLNSLQECCNCLRELCIHDDLRREMSCAHENGRFFTNASLLVPALLGFAGRFQEFPDLASSALSATRALVTTEEAVKIVAQNGAMALPSSILSYPEAAVVLVRSVLGLTRNLCADDIRKDKLAVDGTLDLIIRALHTEKYNNDFPLVEHGIACVAAMSLRSPSNSTRIVQSGAMPVLIKCMGKHTEKAGLQRQAALAFRNIAARCPEFRESLLDAGAESALRAAGRLREVVDEAYAALRDLGCDVQFVRVNEDGSVEAAFDQFGSGASKPKFNPVFEETYDIMTRMQAESQAPLTRHGTLSRLEEGDDDDVDDGIEDDGCCGGGGNMAHSHDHDHHH